MNTNLFLFFVFSEYSLFRMRIDEQQLTGHGRGVAWQDLRGRGRDDVGPRAARQRLERHPAALGDQRRQRARPVLGC